MLPLYNNPCGVVRLRTDVDAGALFGRWLGRDDVRLGRDDVVDDDGVVGGGGWTPQRHSALGQRYNGAQNREGNDTSGGCLETRR